MPKWVEDCIESVKPSLKRRYPSDKPDRITSRAYAICMAAYQKYSGREVIDAVNVIEEFGETDMAEFNQQVFYWQSAMAVTETLTEAMKTLTGTKFVSPLAESILKEEATIVVTPDSSDSDSTAYTVSPKSYTGTSTGTDVFFSEATETVGVEPPSPHLFISGEAIHAGTTRNMNQYLATELAKAAPSLVGKPIQLDHSHKSLDNVGKVIAASFSQETGTLRYVGRLQRSSPIAEKVEIGDMDTVSIGAHAKDIVCGICGTSRIIRDRSNRGCKHTPGGTYDGVTATNVGIDIDFVELSLTPVPADPRASAMAVTHDSMESALFALAESFQFGDETKMAENEEAQSPEMIEALRAKNEQLEAALETAQLREKERVANGIAGAEVQLGLLNEKDKASRLAALINKPIEALELLSTSLEMRVERETREIPKSKGIITESEPQDEPIRYDDLKAFVRRRLFNWDAPSHKAVQKVQEMAMNPQSDVHREYIDFLGLGGNQ